MKKNVMLTPLVRFSSTPLVLMLTLLVVPLVVPSGNDILIGGAGKDLLTTGTGNDLLIGGAGDELLWPPRIVQESRRWRDGGRHRQICERHVERRAA